MKSFFRVLAYIKDYKLFAALNVLFNILAAIFSLICLTMVKPILDLLFKDNTSFEAFLAPNPNQSIGKDFLEYELNHWFAEIIINNSDGELAGKKMALLLLCVFTAFAFLSKNLFTFLSLYFMAPVRIGIVTSLRKKMFEKILKLNIGFFSDERKGDIMSRMTNDVMEVEWSILTSLEALFREPLTVIIFLTTMFIYDWQLTLIVLILAPVSGFAISRIGKSLKRTSAKTQEKTAEVLSIIEETLGGLKIIKAFSVENIIFNKFNKTNHRFYQLSTRVYRKNGLSSPLSEFLGITIFCLVLWIGGNKVFNGTFEGSSFITFLLYFYALLAPIKGFAKAYSSAKKGSASLDRIDKILKAENKIESIDNAVDIKDLDSNIELKNVSFKYHEELVLKNVNLSIPKGKTVALVGHSGSGKSTLADLIPRFHEVTEGSIAMNGTDIKELDLAQLRSLTGIVTQESILFNDTVRNNLTFGVDGVSDEQIQVALKTANALEFVEGLDNGLDTNIGDRGGKLSGGQKQRLCIARAVLKNPPILILDEATSALDTASEKVVQDALDNVMQNRTAIVIAHRLSTIRNADVIVVLDKGEIVEQGSHNELLELNGHYSELCKLQNWN